MRIPRIFVDANLASGKHVTKVLRLRSGAALMVFDGSGTEFEAVLEIFQHEKTTVHIGKLTTTDKESPLQITLC